MHAPRFRVVVRLLLLLHEGLHVLREEALALTGLIRRVSEANILRGVEQPLGRIGVVCAASHGGVANVSIDTQCDVELSGAGPSTF